MSPWYECSYLAPQCTLSDIDMYMYITYKRDRDRYRDRETARDREKENIMRERERWGKTNAPSLIISSLSKACVNSHWPQFGVSLPSQVSSAPKFTAPRYAPDLPYQERSELSIRNQGMENWRRDGVINSSTPDEPRNDHKASVIFSHDARSLTWNKACI